MKNRKTILTSILILFALLLPPVFYAAEPSAAQDESISLIATVRDTTEGVTRSYSYDGNGLLTKQTYQQEAGEPYLTTYEYDSKGNLIKSTDVAENFVSQYRYDSQGYLLSEVVEGKDFMPAWENGKCVRYNAVTYTYDAKGRVLTQTLKDFENYIDGRIVKGDEVNTYLYDEHDNVSTTKTVFAGQYNSEETFRMEYKDGLIVKAEDSTFSDVYTFTYKKATVPAKYVKIVKAQQKILLHSLNYSAPTIMRAIQFASGGNLAAESGVVVPATPTPTISPTPTPTPTLSGTYKVGDFTVSVKGTSATIKGAVNKNATKLTIPSKVTVQGTKLKVTGIAAGAFQSMKKLSSVTIGKYVKTIGKKAFYNCAKLKKITIQTTKLTSGSIGSKAFTGIYKKATIKCPASKVADYKKILLTKGMTKKMTFQ